MAYLAVASAADAASQGAKRRTVAAPCKLAAASSISSDNRAAIARELLDVALSVSRPKVASMSWPKTYAPMD